MEITTEYPDNGYGGYDNGEKKIWHDTNKNRYIIIATCSNCGDGSWTWLSEPKS